jgi:hypothetical protein
MQKKLRYDWTITLFHRPWWWLWFERESRKLEVRSSQPQVAQYAASAGRMKAHVEISYKEETLNNIPAASVKITQSSDFGIFAKYERADLIGFALATAASLASGIMLYALKPTFVGSLQDYLTLFTWGASLDQGKNFLQSLGTYAVTAGKPAPQGQGGA